MEHLQTVQQIFSDKLFKVPDYQRGYAWDETQWNDLIEDLELLQEEQEHYTGTLVLYYDETKEHITDEEGKKLDIYDIVDGQQRLATIVILLHCISKELKAKSNRDKLADGIRKNFITFRDIFSQERSRLILNKDCHEYFVQNVISLIPTIHGPIIKSHERLAGALEFYEKYLANAKTEFSNFEEWMIKLHLKITNSLKFTVYQVPRKSDVGVIFEVMNNRGKPLSEMEKVKNYLLYLTSKLSPKNMEELSEKINNEWGSIFQRLMSANDSSHENEDRLLRSSWLMAYNPYARDWHGYSSIKEKFSLKKYFPAGLESSIINDLNDYINILSVSCIAYCDIKSPFNEDSFKTFHELPDIKRSLKNKTEKISRIGNIAPFLPLLMAARIKYPEDHLFFEELLEICEKYAFRIFRFHNYRSNTGQASLFTLGNKLFNGKVTKSEVIRKIKSLMIYYSSQERYKEKLELGKINWYQVYGLKYFLYEYEEYLAKGKAVQLPWEKLARTDKEESVEHILPQDPSREYWQNRWSQENIDKYKHDIGNLTLTFDNSVYGNKSFIEKRGVPGRSSCYANSNLFQEKELAIYDDWTEKELLERRKKIIDWALERWKVETDLIEQVEFEEEEVVQEEDNDVEVYSPEEQPALKEWSKDEIIEYFERLKVWHEFTYLYFKILASSPDPIEYKELIKKIKELSGKEFTGKNICGIFGGLTIQTTKKGRERLHREFFEKGWKYSLNRKYEKTIKKYFEEHQ